MNIQPYYFTVDELLKSRLFRIPRYQRAYSWQKKQRQDMFDDISKLKGNPDNTHFMATVVGLYRETKEIVTTDYRIIEIVDGQQRLTTLALLLKTIQQKLASSLTEADRLAKTPEARLELELQELLVKPDELSLLLLQTNHDSSHYFANFLRNGSYPSISEAKTLADRELLRAIDDCKYFVNKWENTLELLRIIKNQLRFIFHEIVDESVVYTVFEVLNDRGLTVTWLDKFKSMLMAVAFENDQGNRSEHIDELHRIWGEIYQNVGLHEGLDTDALRFAATLKNPVSVGRPLDEETSVHRLMSKVGTSTAKAIDISRWLLEVTIATNKVAGVIKPFKDVVNRTLQSKLLAVSILLRNFPREQERKLLNECERITYLIYVLCKEWANTTAKTAAGNYIRLAWSIMNQEDFQFDDILTRIDRLRVVNYSYGKIKFHPWNLLNGRDCYNSWQKELRYLLCRYEEYLSAQQGQQFSNEQWNRIWEKSAASSIEHILPQSKSSQIESSVHRLGNLLLLPSGMNSRLSDKDPEEKADDYNQFGFFDAKQVAQTIKTHGWTDEQIEDREVEIISWVESEWGDALVEYE